MSRCFGSSSNLSAKEYTYKKRNLNMFCDLRTKYIANGKKHTGNTDACVDSSGVICHFNNNTIKLQIKKGYEEFLPIKEDISGQKIKDYFCLPYNVDISNTDISNNYTGMILTTRENTAHIFQIVVDSSGNHVNRYAEINTVVDTDHNLFQNGKQTITIKCPTRNSDKINVLDT